MLFVQVMVAEEQKKGSDSAINNGGKRPGLVGASPTPEDIEMTERELEAEDEEAAIEERQGPAFFCSSCLGWCLACLPCSTALFGGIMRNTAHAMIPSGWLYMIIAHAARRMSRLLETWCLMEYAEKGSLADALRTGRLRRPGGFPELGVIIACLQDIASGRLLLFSSRTAQSWLSLLRA